MHEMEGFAKLKPLKVKVSHPGLNYVMVLVQRDCLVAGLKKEIQETLKQLFPCRNCCSISNLRKDNGKVLLPDWYPVEPLLQDNEEVFISFDSLNTDNNQCMDNEIYFSRGHQRSFDRSIDGQLQHSHALVHMNQAESQMRQISSTGMRSSATAHNHDLLKDMTEIGMVNLNDSDVDDLVDRVLQTEDKINPKKRKGNSEVISDIPVLSMTLEQSKENSHSSPFKRSKFDVPHNDVKPDSEMQETHPTEGSFSLLSSESILSPLAEAVKIDANSFHRNNHGNTNSDNCAHEGGSKDVVILRDDNETNCKKKSDKKKSKHKKEQNNENVIKVAKGVDRCDGLKLEDQEANLEKTKKSKKRKKEKSIVETLRNLDSNGEFDSTASYNPTQGMERNNQTDSKIDGKDDEVNELKVDNKEKKKKKKKKAEGKEKSKYTESSETLFSSSSMAISDVKESGIGSDSTVYDMEKLAPQHANDSIITESDKSKKKKLQRDVIDITASLPLNLDQMKSVRDITLESQPKKKKEKSKSKGTSDIDGSEASFKKINGGIKSNKFKVPCARQGKGAKENDVSKDSPEKAEKSSLFDNADKADDNRSPVHKPTFEYDTDAEIGKIKSKILKVVGDIVEDSDYSQSLIQEPLKFPIDTPKTKHVVQSKITTTDEEINLVNGGRKPMGMTASKSSPGDVHISSTEKEDCSPTEPDTMKIEDMKEIETDRPLSNKKRARNTIKSKNIMKVKLRSMKKRLPSDSDTSSISFSDVEITDAAEDEIKTRRKSTVMKGQKISKLDGSLKQGVNQTVKETGVQKREGENEGKQIKENGGENETKNDVEQKPNGEQRPDGEQKPDGEQRLDGEKKLDGKRKQYGEQKQDGKQKQTGKQNPDVEQDSEQREDDEQKQDNNQKQDAGKDAKQDTGKENNKKGNPEKLKDINLSNVNGEGNEELNSVESKTANGSDKFVTKKKKRRKKSTRGSEISLAKVQDWLSQMEEDVPTETEIDYDNDISKNESADPKRKPSIDKKTSIDSASKKVITSEEVVQSFTQKKLNSSLLSDVDIGGNNVDKDSLADEMFGTDLDISKTIETPVKCSQESKEDAEKVNKGAPAKRTRAKMKSLGKNHLDKEDGEADLKFDALLEGGSVISSTVKQPMESKTGNSIKKQRRITGFLSSADQKRFLQKVKNSPTVK